MAAIPQNNQGGLCDYCHQKPKFGNYNYCGKTCSQQAATMLQTNAQPQITATLCKQCNQRPRFQNFEFCGKNCASAWQLANGGPNANPNSNVKSTGNAGQKSNVGITNKLLGHLPQPLQAKIQSAIPAVTAALQPGNKGVQQNQQPPANIVTPVPPFNNVPQQSTAATTLAPGNPGANPPQPPHVNQNINGGFGPGFPVPQVAHQGPVNGTNNNVVPTSVPGQVQTVVPTTCRLTGCGKPVYTDATHNHASEYCSKRHREEAVITGQVNACIMCLKMPRSSTDHFCSKVCRDAALSQ